MTPALMNYIGGVIETLSVLVVIFTFLLWILAVVMGFGVLMALEDNAPIGKKLRRHFILLVALAMLSTLITILIPDRKTFNDLYNTYWKVDANIPSNN